MTGMRRERRSMVPPDGGATIAPSQGDPDVPLLRSETEDEDLQATFTVARTITP